MKRFRIASIFTVVLCYYLFPLPHNAFGKELITLLPKLINEHEQIKAAEANRNEALHLHEAARGGRLPSVDVSTDVSREWVEKADDTKTTETANFQDIKLTQLLTDFGTTSSQVNRTQTNYQKTKAELETARQEVLVKGISAYLGVVKAREKLKYALRSEENIKEQTGMEEVLLEKKAGLSSDYLQTKAQLARARALRVSVEGELVIAKNRFQAVFAKALSGVEMESFNLPKLPDKKMPATLEEAIVRAHENNPQILAYLYALELSKLDVEISKKGNYFPRVNAFAEALRRENDIGVVGVRHEEIVGLELSYNLFRGGADKATIKAAAENVEEARNIYVEGKRLIEEQIRNAWQNLITSKEKQSYLKTQSEIVGEFLNLARKERKLGSRSLLDVLSGEVDYINAISESVAAEIDIYLATYNLFFAMGDLTLELL